MKSPTTSPAARRRSFEPTIDYVVTKVPRFAFEKFPGASTTLTTPMKSVGEVMAIGRTFQESLQKALRGLETGLTGLDEIEIEGLGRGDDKNAIRAALGTPTPNRILQVAQAMRSAGRTRSSPCKIDPWFLSEMRGIVDMEAKVKANGLPPNGYGMRMLKAMGFSDARLAVLSESTEAEITAKRRALGVRPAFKRIDTCAAEFASPTAYMYSTYEAPFAGTLADESAPSDKKKVVILGGGRTGSARASSSTIAAATPASRSPTPAMRPSWSTAIRRRCRPTTTPPTGSISSRSPPRTCWKSSPPNGRTARCTA